MQAFPGEAFKTGSTGLPNSAGGAPLFEELVGFGLLAVWLVCVRADMELIAAADSSCAVGVHLF